MRADRILELIRKQTGEFCTGADAIQIERASGRLGFRLPPPLAEWLEICNGSQAGPGGILGIEQAQKIRDIESRLLLYPAWKEKRWIPVATDGCGNHYVLVRDEAVPTTFPICFIDNARDEDVLDYAVASELFAFLTFLLEREVGISEYWPFDRDAVLLEDPTLAKISVAPLPWNVD